MDIITTIFSYFWYEFFFVLYIIIVVYLSQMKFYTFTPHNISDNVPHDFETYYQPSDQEFSDLGWIRLGTFHCTHPEDENTLIVRLFCSPDYNHVASLARCEASDGHFMYLTEFCSELSPSAYILTNNNPNPSSITHSNKFVFKFPSIKSVKALYHHHLDFCKVAQLECFNIISTNPGCLEKRLYDEFKKDCEYQVKKGWMKKVDETSYAPTLRGVVLGVPILAIHFLYSSLFSLFRPKKETLVKCLKRKLVKIKQKQLYL